MKKKLVACMFMALALGGCAANNQNQVGGTLIGGAAGGLLGSQVGGGKGRLVAVGIGTLAGAMAGGAIGQSMDNQNQAKQAK